MPKKILIVSYYWPPSGGVGVQRWLHFSNYLAQYGFDVTVYIPSNPSYPILDPSLVSQVSDTITVIQQPIWEPYALAEFINPKNKAYKSGKFNTQNPSWLSTLSVFIRGNLFIPDARKFWVRSSVRYLNTYITQHSIDTIITTGPPHSMHLIGLRLKKKIPSLQWLADFRDPWTGISYHKDLKLTSWAKKQHKRLEEEVLTTADTVLAASFTDAFEYEKMGAQSVSLTNGYETLLPLKTTPNPQFTISYIGKLEQQRNPYIFWESLQELSDEYPDFKKDLRIELVGSIDAEIEKKLKNSKLSHHIDWIGYVPHKEALQYIQGSDLLLLSNFEKEENKGIIPAKLFEYLSSRNPILSMGPKGADVAQILQETQSGRHFTSFDKEPLKKYVFEVYLNWKKNKKAISSLGIEKYSRKEISKKLFQLIQKV